jgi:hypothetical protein
MIIALACAGLDAMARWTVSAAENATQLKPFFAPRHCKEHCMVKRNRNRKKRKET